MKLSNKNINELFKILPSHIQITEKKTCMCGEEIEHKQTYDFHFEIEDSYNLYNKKNRKYRIWYKWQVIYVENTDLKLALIHLIKILTTYIKDMEYLS